MDLLASLPISLRQLQYIVAIADRGGFGRAANACHVAQPSLSAQVALAEQALGVRLFERDRRQVRATTAGGPIVDQARRILVAATDLGDLARQLTNPFRGTLRVGAIPTVCPYVLPEIAPALARAFPDLTIAWSEHRTASLVRRIKDGALEAAIVALEADLGDLEHVELAWDPFLLAAAPAHPLVRARTPARLDQLEQAQLLLLDDGHCFRDQALALCARAGASELGLRATSLATLVQMVSAGDGVTLLPSLALPVENRRGQLAVRRFVQPAPGRTVVLAWRRGSALAPALKVLADTMRKALASLLPQRSSEGGRLALGAVGTPAPVRRRRSISRA